MPIIQSVERALQILDLFNEQATELKITDISKLMGLSKSTLHSLLKTLQLHGYIDQNPENGKYRLGMKLVERGHFVVGSIDIRQKAKGWLTELSQRTGQTTHLGILDGREGVYIEKIEGKLAAIAYSRIGRRLPVHATAIGKVLIAWLGEAELNALLEGYQYTTYTPSTLASREACGCPDADPRTRLRPGQRRERAGRALRGGAGVEPRIPRDCRPEPVDLDLARGRRRAG